MCVLCSIRHVWEEKQHCCSSQGMHMFFERKRAFMARAGV